MEEPPHGVLRGAFETTGSCRWVMHVIQTFGLDLRHGFRLQLDLAPDQVQSNKESVEVALQEGRADVISIDWISLARERARGVPIAAGCPYGQTVGGLVVAADCKVRELKDLAKGNGFRLGVVRAVDKNWILLRAGCRSLYGFDPLESVQLVEVGSKTALSRSLRERKVDGILQFWQLIPYLTADGSHRLVADNVEMIAALGIKEKIPISCFTFPDALLERRPGTVRAFALALADAAEMLKRDDTLWEEIGRSVDGATPVVMASLRNSWRQKVVANWTSATVEAIRRLFERLLEVGGPQLMGVDQLPAGTFRTEFAGPDLR